MTTHELIIAGFGGQGVLFLGEALARAALRDGREVTWLPAYGPEQRGGTANCTVVISDQPVGSPVAAAPSVVIAMNRPSLDRFEPQVRSGGLIVYDTAMITRAVSRTDLTAVGVAATAIASGLGSPRAANIVLLGALLAVLPVVSPDAAAGALAELVHDPQTRARNAAALDQGGRSAATAHVPA